MMSTINGLLTLLLIILFLGIWRWAWSDRNIEQFIDMSRLPLEDDEANTVDAEGNTEGQHHEQ